MMTALNEAEIVLLEKTVKNVGLYWTIINQQIVSNGPPVAVMEGK